MAVGPASCGAAGGGTGCVTSHYDAGMYNSTTYLTAILNSTLQTSDFGSLDAGQAAFFAATPDSTSATYETYAWLWLRTAAAGLINTTSPDLAIF